MVTTQLVRISATNFDDAVKLLIYDGYEYAKPLTSHPLIRNYMCFSLEPLDAGSLYPLL